MWLLKLMFMLPVLQCSPNTQWDGPNQSASIKCGKNTYDGHDVYLAAQHGVNLGLLSPPETRGEKKFPHAFDHDDSKGVKLHFPKHCPENDKNRQEYPLVKNGHPLVYYCGLMTHDGAAKGGFIQCPDGK